jgi:hypothetical protein
MTREEKGVRPMLAVTIRRGLLIAALGLAAGPAAGDSIRCDGGLVSVGDSRLDLLAKCGPPSLQEVEAILATGAVDLSLLIERWTYDFGPQRFIQIVSLRGGKVLAVETGSYGYALPEPPRAPPELAAIPRARCQHDALHLGDFTYEVLARCGEPFSRDLRRGKAVWTYDFGPLSLVRFLEFEGGRLLRIRTGGYGYSK